ncbi:MAG: aminoacyl-tRNA hydrolase [Myxococcota bacterium]
MHLVLGLGNPGRQYEPTRHNAGFLVVDRLAERHGFSCDKRQFNALVGKSRVGTTDAMFAKPQGFMNRSGHPASSLRGYYKVAPSDVVVVHDELDLPFGDIRVKVGGGHGGHNGLRDLLAQLGGGDFARVRFGIGRPPVGWEVSDYVLAKWSSAERDVLDGHVDHAVEVLEAVLSDGPRAAMNQFNVRRPGRSADAEPSTD